jgi:hypothetical protein
VFTLHCVKAPRSRPEPIMVTAALGTAVLDAIVMLGSPGGVEAS